LGLDHSASPPRAFTPGPWKAFYKRKYDEWHVAMPYGGGSSMLCPLASDGIEAPDPSQREANAHLIAAAPELYEALDAICSEFAQNHPLIVKGSAALAKARGQQ
jgi:hypothetical protein